VVFSPTGRMLASGCSDPVARLWKLDGEELEAWAVLDEEKSERLGVSGLAFSPDGKKLAAGSFSGRRALRLWNVSGPFMEEVEMPKADARLVVFSPDNKTLAYASPAAVHLWDVKAAKGRRRLELPSQPRSGLAGFVRALTFSPDGGLLAIAGQDRKLILWDTATGKKSRAWQFPEELKALAFACDGRHLAVGDGSGSVIILRLETIGLHLQ
jgi:WD40 repeat protein